MFYLAFKIKSLGSVGTSNSRLSESGNKKIGVSTRIAQFLLLLNLNFIDVRSEEIFDGGKSGLKENKTVHGALSQNGNGGVRSVLSPAFDFERAGDFLNKGAKTHSLNFASNSQKNLLHDRSSEGAFKNIRPLVADRVSGEKEDRYMFAFQDGGTKQNAGGSQKWTPQEWENQIKNQVEYSKLNDKEKTFINALILNCTQTLEGKNIQVGEIDSGFLKRNGDASVYREQAQKVLNSFVDEAVALGFKVAHLRQEGMRFIVEYDMNKRERAANEFAPPEIEATADLKKSTETSTTQKLTQGHIIKIIQHEQRILTNDKSKNNTYRDIALDREEIGEMARRIYFGEHEIISTAGRNNTFRDFCYYLIANTLFEIKNTYEVDLGKSFIGTNSIEITGGEPAQTQQTRKETKTVKKTDTQKEIEKTREGTTTVQPQKTIKILDLGTEFAKDATTFASSMGLEKEMENMAKLLNDERCEWSPEAKRQFMNYLAGITFFAPESERAKLLAVNLASGGNTLISNLVVWDETSANEYILMLYRKASGDNSNLEQVQNNLFDISALREFRRAVDESPLYGQITAQDGFGQETTTNEIRRQTIERSALSQFLLYTAPALVYNDRNLDNLQVTIDRLAEIDDLIIANTGTSSDVQKRNEAGVIGVKNFYAAVVPAFAYAAGYEGILHSRIEDITEFLYENSHKLDELTRAQIKKILASSGVFVPLDRQEVMDTQDGYLALDMMRAANVAYVMQISAMIPNFDVRPSADVVSRPWLMLMGTQDIDSRLLPDRSRMYNYFSINPRFKEVIGEDGETSGVEIELVDQNGKQIQIDVSRSPIDARFDSNMPRETIIVRGSQNEDILFTGEGAQGESDYQNLGLAIKMSTASAYGFGRTVETDSDTDKTINLRGSWNFLSTETKRDELGRSPQYKYGEGMLSVTGDVNYDIRENSDKNTRIETGSGRGEGYNIISSSNLMSDIYTRWWQLFATRWTDDRKETTIQSGFDRLTDENRRFGAYLGEINNPEGYYRCEDILLNPFSYRDFRNPYFRGLYQAGLGEKELFLSQKGSEGSKINAALDFGDKTSYRLTGGAYHNDSNLGGFLNPRRNTAIVNPVQTFENYFVMGFWEGMRLSQVASASNVSQINRNQLQLGYGISDPGTWMGEIVGLRRNDTGDIGEIARGYYAFGNGKINRLDGVQIYDPSYGSGLNIKFASPSVVLWGAGYTQQLEFGGQNTSNLGLDNSYLKTDRNTEWNVLKGYARTKIGSGQLQASAAAHPRFNIGAMRFVFSDGKYLGAFVDERKDVENQRGNNTAWGTGFGGGFDLGKGFRWSGAGLLNDPYGSSSYSRANYWGDINVPGVGSLLGNERPGAFSASTGFEFRNSLVLRGGIKVYHNYNDPLGEIGLYYQATPYSQLQATYNQTQFDQRLGIALESTGAGFEASNWIVPLPIGLSGSYSIVISKQDAANKYGIQKYEASYNLSPQFSIYGLHWNIQAQDYSALRNMLGLKWITPIDNLGYAFIFGEGEAWNIKTAAQVRDEWRFNVGAGIKINIK